MKEMKDIASTKENQSKENSKENSKEDSEENSEPDPLSGMMKVWTSFKSSWISNRSSKLLRIHLLTPPSHQELLKSTAQQLKDVPLSENEKILIN